MLADDLGHGYPAYGKPLAPRLLVGLISGVPADPVARELGRLADFDGFLTARLDRGSMEGVAVEVVRAVGVRWFRVAEARPYHGDGDKITDIRLSERTRELLRAVSPGRLAQLTVGVLLQIPGFGPLQLLDYVASLEAGALFGLLGEFDVDLVTPPSSVSAPRRGVSAAQAADAAVRRAKTRYRQIVLAEEFYSRWISGRGLEEIGKNHNLSRERVRQIIAEGGFDPEEGKKLSLAARAHAVERRKQEQFDAHRDEIVAAIEAGESLPVIGAKTGVPAPLIREMVVKLPELKRLRWMIGSQNRPAKHYTTEELLDCLRDANQAIGGVLTVQYYNTYAETQTFADGRPWPTNQTMGLRFGGWRSALTAAGLRSNAASAIAGQLLFTKEHCIDAVVEVGRQLGRVPRAADYELVASQSAGSLPSLATVRNRLGSWSAALRQAADYL